MMTEKEMDEIAVRQTLLAFGAKAKLDRIAELLNSSKHMNMVDKQDIIDIIENDNLGDMMQ